MTKIDKAQFEADLRGRLGGSWKRAEKIFENYGPRLSFDVTNVLIHAADQDKVIDVLIALEEHYNAHLQYQHPEIRGQVTNLVTGNSTQQTFLGICRDTLGLWVT